MAGQELARELGATPVTSRAVRVKITGLVHGVVFRATMAHVASDYGVRGWVRNHPDGFVQAFLEGEEEDVERVLEWAKRGPPRARVDNIAIQKAAPRNSRGFKIEG